MSNETTSNTRHCDQCAVLITDENQGFFQWRDRCNRCHSRLELDDKLLEIAYVANQFYKSDDQVIDLQHQLAERRLRVHELKRPIEDGGDPRLAHIWSTLWDALSGDIERDATWGLFIDAIAGDVPDYRTKTYGGVVTLKFYFSDVEIDGDVGRDELEQAILDAVEGDLRYGYEDECEVDYEEE